MFEKPEQCILVGITKLKLNQAQFSRKKLGEIAKDTKNHTNFNEFTISMIEQDEIGTMQAMINMLQWGEMNLRKHAKQGWISHMRVLEVLNKKETNGNNII